MAEFSLRSILVSLRYLDSCQFLMLMLIIVQVHVNRLESLSHIVLDLVCPGQGLRRDVNSYAVSNILLQSDS